MEQDDLVKKLRELANRPVKLVEEVPEPEVKGHEPIKLKEEPRPVLVSKPEVHEPNRSRKSVISVRLGEILAEHDGLESNVPSLKSHEYWQLKAELNQL